MSVSLSSFIGDFVDNHEIKHKNEFKKNKNDYKITNEYYVVKKNIG